MPSDDTEPNSKEEETPVPAVGILSLGVCGIPWKHVVPCPSPNNGGTGEYTPDEQEERCGANANAAHP
eukprot:CAMPEP_0181061644 /NCGR_PEP_ID=MMETSP1070-20121207/22640_1 /TAXON_ID=265543 /ORGANISM="Minutocellus polymorphus, Strain NH13" /LENGTH=67 /DNA_ID=CAMNT_0023141631 /DNA_START=128 /DNA_END=327 /DNA_ORIENTATION=-